MKKRLLAIVLSVVMVVGLIPSLAFAAKADNEENTSAKKSIDVSGFEEVEAFRAKDNDSKVSSQSGDSLPSKVDLRDRGVITPVKFQNPFGTCWAFGSVAAAETSILTELGTTYSEYPINLSEKHLAWFAMNALDDPSSSQNGEGMHFIENISSGEKLSYGGMEFYAAGLFAQGAGPALEADFPYKGKNGKIQRRVNKDGDIYDFCYSDKDDWSIAEKYRFTSEYKLEHGYIFPSTVLLDNDNKLIGYDEDLLTTIKEQINQGIAVGMTYCADTSMPGEDGNTEYMNQTNWCQYTDEYIYANHEVCIVGYDDNYSKSNFNSAHQPSKDGAFLVKNSWGSGEEEFPNNGGGSWGIVNEDGEKTGYFWLSYYDQTIYSFVTYDFDVDDTEYTSTKQIVDQYDFAGYDSAKTAETKKECSMANVYTAEYNQVLKEVGTVSSTPNTEVKYEVYILDANAQNATSGTLASTASETYAFGGFHRATLDKPVKLAKGQRYSVVVTETNPDGKNEITIPILEHSLAASTDNSLPWYATTIVNRDESFIKYDGEWYDWYDTADAFNNLYWDGIDADNLTIKAYSVPDSNGGPVLKTLTSGKKSFKATWGKSSKAAAYQLQYSTVSDFSSNKKTITIKGAKNTSKTVSNLKSKKTYYVRVRSYKTVNGKKKYSNWSVVKSVTTK